MIFEQLHFLVILSCCCISWQQIFHTLCFVIQIKPAYVIPDQVCCAVIRYHSRRVTCLEFHPTKNNILLSGDKVRLMLCIVVDTSFFIRMHYFIIIVLHFIYLPFLLFSYSSSFGSVEKKGQVGVWDFDKVHERMVYQNIHTCIVNNMRWTLIHEILVFFLFTWSCGVNKEQLSRVFSGLNLQMMVWYMLHPLMEQLVALIWRLECHHLWWTLILMVGR